MLEWDSLITFLKLSLLLFLSQFMHLMCVTFLLCVLFLIIHFEETAVIVILLRDRARVVADLSYLLSYSLPKSIPIV